MKTLEKIGAQRLSYDKLLQGLEDRAFFVEERRQNNNSILTTRFDMTGEGFLAGCVKVDCLWILKPGLN